MDILFKIQVTMSITILELKNIEALQDSFHYTTLADVYRAS